MRLLPQAEAGVGSAERLRGTGRAGVGVEHERGDGGELCGGRVRVFGFAQRAELLHLAQNWLEVLQSDAVGEIAGGGGWAAVSKLCLDCAQIVSRVPDVLGESAAEIMDAELGADSGALLQCLPLLGEAGRRSGRSARAMSAKDVDDGLLTVGTWRKFLDHFRDRGADRERLVHVALGVEGQRAEVRVVVRCADFGSGAMPKAEVSAEEQEESERGTGGVEELAALFVGGNGGARLRLMDARDRVADRERRGVDAFQPAEKTAETLRVRRARVLRELRRLPRLGGALDVIRGELCCGQLAEVG